MSRLSILEAPISSFVTGGLAHMSGFELLKHGTNTGNYWSILSTGADPSLGGSSTGVERCAGYFHVLKDHNRHDEATMDELPIIPLHELFGPTIFKGFSALSATDNIVLKVIYFAISIFTPTLNFMYRTSEIPAIFENDPDFQGRAWRTREALPHDRIGLYGLLSHVTVTDLTSQISDHPLTFLRGLVETITGIYLTSTGLGFIL
ncbi:MAG: hypothetical protein SP1CHLAM54_05720 [Chlamydiia bacterium]|nr:hypothetical protein [Chlamydiia bacterium]MCH9615482.1 hypothetical protein [Chlamydiia bacterium]MCH9629137.1 hypothetical protein [Chlamydiia bacterium]